MITSETNIHRPDYLEAMKRGITAQLKDHFVDEVTEELVADVTKRIATIVREELEKYVISNLTSFIDHKHMINQLCVDIKFREEKTDD